MSAACRHIHNFLQENIKNIYIYISSFPSWMVYGRGKVGRGGTRQTFTLLVPGTTSKCKLRGKCFGMTLSFLFSLPFPSFPSHCLATHTHTAFGSRFKRQLVYHTGASCQEMRSLTPEFIFRSSSKANKKETKKENVSIRGKDGSRFWLRRIRSAS